MASMRTLINGAGGRIGRGVTYELVKRMGDIVNRHNNGAYLISLNEPRGMKFILKNYTSRDKVHGIYDWEVKKVSENTLTLNGIPVSFYATKDPNSLPIKEEGIEMVIECSGFYGDPKTESPTKADNGGRVFLEKGAKKVIETYPSVKTSDAVLIMGVNHEDYIPKSHHIISNASCTTKSLAVPLRALLDQGVGIERLFMDTVHATTESQGALETLNQILTHKTGAAKATGYVLPSLKGRMDGMAWRVQADDGSFSCLNFVATYDKGELTKESINEIMRESVSDRRYSERIMVLEDEEVTTQDIVKKKENAIVVLSKTGVMPLGRLETKEGTKPAYLVKIVSGYDNELGSCVDPVLLADFIASRE